MKTPSFKSPFVIRINTARVNVGEVYPSCGYVRVTGWVSAPNKNEGFTADRLLAQRFEARTIGGYCDAKTDCEVVSFPFSFDVPLALRSDVLRRESMEEAVPRVLKVLRSAKRYFRTVK